MRYMRHSHQHTPLHKVELGPPRDCARLSSAHVFDLATTTGTPC